MLRVGKTQCTSYEGYRSTHVLQVGGVRLTNSVPSAHCLTTVPLLPACRLAACGWRR